MSKHTPGPWKWIDTEFYGDPLEGPNKNCLVGPPSDPDCKPYATDSSDHVVYFETPIENEANARLIAAAPELLEACEQIYHDAKIHGVLESNCLDRVLMAIKKARGE